MKYCTIAETAKRWNVSKTLVRRYLQQERIPRVIQEDGVWLIPEKAKKPGAVNAPIYEPLGQLARKVRYQCGQNSHYGIYEYIQVNLAYSSSRMASNRLTREQALEIYRKGKVFVAFEPMKVDDVVEIANHFRAGRNMVDNIIEPLSATYIRKIHSILFRGTVADQEEVLHIGEYRKTPDKFGVAASSIALQLNLLIDEYENKKTIELHDILDFHARFEQIHPFEDGNGRVGRLLMVKECLRHNVEPFIIDDKHRGEYNRGISQWATNPALLTEVAEQAQDRFRNFKETLDLMEYCRPPRTVR